MASYSTNLSVKQMKNAVLTGFLGVVFTPMMQEMVTDANITGIAGTILGYIPMIVAAGVLLHQFDYF